MIWSRAASLLLLGVFALHHSAHAQGSVSPAAYCRRVGVDDQSRPIPVTLVEAAKQLFSLRADSGYVQRTTVFRCMDGGVQLCTSGANLPCGKADRSRDLPGAGQYCREHPGSDFIPMFVTGHATIYRWRCEGSSAASGEPVEQLDERGFIARLWKPLSQ